MTTTESRADLRRNHFRFGLTVGLAFITMIFVALAIFSLVRSMNRSVAPRALLAVEERKATSLAMPTLDGKQWSLGDHAGKVALVNYFATWCPPCRQEFPDMKQIAAEYAPRGIAFAAVSLDKDSDRNRPREEILNEFNADEQLPFPILLPPAESPLMTEPLPIPQTFLVDRKGRIAHHLIGPINPETLRPMLDQLLAETP